MIDDQESGDWREFRECPRCGRRALLRDMVVGPPHCGACGYTVADESRRTAEDNADLAGTAHGAVECIGDHGHGACDRWLISGFARPAYWPEFTGIRTTEVPVCDRCGTGHAQGLVTDDGSRVIFGLCGHCTDEFGPAILASGLSLYPVILVGAS